MVDRSRNAMYADHCTSPSHWTRRVLTGFVGLLLLALAVWVLMRNADSVASARRAAASAPLWMLGALVILPLANIGAVSGSLWVMTARHAKVGYWETAALVSIGWLLNNLPLRPGLLGRVAYLKLMYGISIRANIAVLVENLLCAAVAVMMMLGALWFTRQSGASMWLLPLCFVAIGVFCGVVTSLLYRSNRAGIHWRWSACVGFRFVDIVVWAARYWLIFQVMGKALTPFQAGAVASASEAAMLSPVQIGLREWVVGVTSSWMADGVSTALNLAEVSPGLLADMMNRGIEIVLGVPMGIISLVLLTRRMRSRSQSHGRDEGGSALPARSSVAEVMSDKNQ